MTRTGLLVWLSQEVARDEGMVNVLVQRFNEGGPPWMWPILVCFILGLALSLERVVMLNLADVNIRKLLDALRQAWHQGGATAAEAVCSKARGPVATVLRAGLMRHPEGIAAVEKAIVATGSIASGYLERGLVWISLFISLAPMLGFLGTVVGMVEAFDAIQQAGDISPTLVAGGIKVALLTTVFGLIVAMVLQFFYNYIISRIDRIVMDMEEASAEFVDLLATPSGDS
jgi:biopolymer transport protein ExbB